MRTRLVAASVVLAGLLALCLPSPGRADSLEVAPVTVTLLPGQRTASLTLTNRGPAPVTVQVRPFRWTEDDGVAALADTAALAASPPLAEIAPGQSQTVRLLLRQPPGTAEASYRLLIDQLPVAERAMAVRVALRFSVPVFALPDRVAEPDLRWTLETGGGGTVLAVRNAGTRHVAVTGVQLAVPGGGAVPVRTAAHPYVLPGARVRWPLERGRDAGFMARAGSVALTVQSSTGTSLATAAVVGAAP